MNTISSSVSHRPLVTLPGVMLWSGRILQTLVILFLLIASCSVKILQMPIAIEATTKLGYGANLVFGIGILELACVVLYAIPRTSILGAILLTGYLGGAAATHLRASGDPFSTIFPIAIGVIAWGGLFLTEERLRSLIPLRK
jgi:hypothetical protein